MIRQCLRQFYQLITQMPQGTRKENLEGPGKTDNYMILQLKKYFLQRYTGISATIFLLFITSLCGAQTAKENDIDKEYNKCIARDTSTGNIGNCAFTAYGKWNKEMDDAYKKLLDMMKKNDSAKIALRKSQEAWVAYRDAEFSSYDRMFNYSGCKWCLIRHDDRIGLVRARALLLQNYIESFKKK